MYGDKSAFGRGPINNLQSADVDTLVSASHEMGSQQLVIYAPTR